MITIMFGNVLNVVIKTVFLQTISMVLKMILEIQIRNDVQNYNKKARRYLRLNTTVDLKREGCAACGYSIYRGCVTSCSMFDD